jgi:hypothetical protein
MLPLGKGCGEARSLKGLARAGAAFAGVPYNDEAPWI